MELRQTRREEKIRVDRQIINLLSRATYESFPRVLRELVSNSYDADATRVSIDVDLKDGKLTVADSGNGMSPEQFQYFLMIAATTRATRRSPSYQRERIGQFGVGFLAAFPFCEEMVVETTAVDSDAVTTAVIPCATYLKERGSGADPPVELVEQIPVPVSEVSDPRQRRNHYTRITLRKLTPLALDYFQGPQTGHVRGQGTSLKTLSPMERLKWDLQDTVVLDYPPGSPIAEALGQQPVGIEVVLNGECLFRNEPPGQVQETHKTAGDADGIDIEGLRVRYVVTSPWKPVHPVEMRGLRIHVNNVGVGQRQSFGLAVQAGALPRLYWMSGDLYVDKGGREFLALDREGFTNAPSIEALYEHFRSVLRQVENRLSQADTKLKEVESELGVRVRGGGPRPKLVVGSKRELVSRRMNELKELGFRIEKVSPGGRTGTKPPDEQPHQVETGGAPVGDQPARLIPEPIEVDRQSRVIRIFEGHPEFEDSLSTTMGQLAVKYDNWDYRHSLFPACELLPDNTIRVNKDYPLFRNKPHGRLLLRIVVSMTILSMGSQEAKEFARNLLLQWAEEFHDLTP